MGGALVALEAAVERMAMGAGVYMYWEDDPKNEHVLKIKKTYCSWQKANSEEVIIPVCIK